MTMDEFIERALSVPFVIGGRAYDGWDCWGLVFVAYRDVFGIEINNLSEKYDAINIRELHKVVESEKPEWLQVDRPLFGDVALFRVGRYETHVALVLPGGRMIHCEERTGTISERLNTLIWVNRNVGYYRNRQRISGDPSASQ